MTEDFNGVATGVIADGATLDTGLLQITRDGSPNSGDGLLEIEPGGNFGNVDGTTFLSGETGADPHEIVDVAFGGPAFAFGGDFFSPFSGDGIGLEVNGELFLLDGIDGFDTGFFGLVLTGGSFSSLQIVGNPDTGSFQELWSADNFSFAIVPAPGTVSVLALGGFLARRRR